MSVSASTESTLQPGPMRSDAVLPTPRPAVAPASLRCACSCATRAGSWACAILLGLLFAALAGRISTASIRSRSSAAPFQPPGGDPVLGTDYLGQDILAALLSGGRATLLVGFVRGPDHRGDRRHIRGAGGLFRRPDRRGVDEDHRVLPGAADPAVRDGAGHPVRPEIAITTIAIGIVSWPPTARLTRAEFLRLRGLDFVKAARAAGAGPLYLIGRVILPNAAPPIMVSATLAIGTAVLFEGALSFLGLGDPNVMSWGLMIGQNRAYALEAWWTVLLPGAAIFLAVLGVSLVGDAVNDAVNPRLRKRS